jgi:hypothetical protein
MMPMFAVVAAASIDPETVGQIIFLSIGLILLVLLMAVLVAWLRKRMSPAAEDKPQGFTLADLRDLRQKGAMSEQEYEKAKALIVQSAQKSSPKT